MTIKEAQAAWHAALTDSDNHEREHGCMPALGAAFRWPDCPEARRLRRLDLDRHAEYVAARLAAEVAA